MRNLPRFWLWIGAFVVANFVAIGVVVQRGERTDLRPIQIAPADGTTGITGRPTIQVTYARPIDTDSLRAAFHMEPPVSGQLEVTERGFSYRITQALRLGVTYNVVIGPGVHEVGGRTSQAEIRSTLQSRPSHLIILSRNDAPVTGVWSVDPTDPSGQTARRLTDADVDAALASASPLGDAVAYVTTSQGNSLSTLWTRGTDGGTPRALVTDQEGTLTSLGWSPKGDLIAYEFGQTFGATVAQPRLWLAPVNGGELALMYGRSRETGSRPAWSPDGRRIAFYENDQRAIAVFDFTTRLQTIPAQVPSTSSWSATGEAFVYTDRSGTDDPRTLTRVASLADATSHWLTTDGSGADSSPTWSPAGDWIAFTRLSGVTGGVWLVHPDGTEAHPVQMAEGWVYSAPVWAPDGSALAFSRRQARVDSSAVDPQVWLEQIGQKPLKMSIGGSIVAWIP